MSTEFYLIDDNFPRINLLNIPTGVLNLKYTVDLLSCQENKVKKFI
ncbi:PD-(D/E)XK motif protein [Cetobacterium sp.]